MGYMKKVQFSFFQVKYRFFYQKIDFLGQKSIFSEMSDFEK